MQMKSTRDTNVYRVTSTYNGYHASFRVIARDTINAPRVLQRDMNKYECIAFFNIDAYIEVKRV